MIGVILLHSTATEGNKCSLPMPCMRHYLLFLQMHDLRGTIDKNLTWDCVIAILCNLSLYISPSQLKYR